jgi:response regulator RpfG family c-di-GMP phosphodiesterase
MGFVTHQCISPHTGRTEAGQGTTTTTLATLGTIRSDSEAFAQKLANLEADTYSSDPSEQTEVGVLGKINTATLLQVHSQQDTNQILAAAVQQQLVAQKQQIDQQNRLINQAIYFQQNFPNTMQQLTGGVSDAIRTISLSPSGR